MDWASSNIGIGITNPANRLDIASSVRSGTHGTGFPLYVTGPLAAGSAGSAGIEFRHENGTQGIGFGFNTMYATGSNISQDLGLRSKGTGNLEFLHRCISTHVYFLERMDEWALARLILDIYSI
ncbi:MAG: hypothetical protein IPK03_04485 [Bacteroidetes bacterium]|nr:hypothetical protein [Bacteroidota bacterium]